MRGGKTRKQTQPPTPNANNHKQPLKFAKMATAIQLEHTKRIDFIPINYFEK